MFVTFEGIEGSGKSTLIKSVAEELSQRDIPHVVTREPGGSSLGRELREILLGRDVSPMAELLLFMADRAQHVEEIVKPALAEGKVVLCDRFTHSTLAYQGAGRGLKNLEPLCETACCGVHPDITFVLDLPVEVGIARARARDIKKDGKAGRFESEDLAFHSRIRQAYRDFAESDPTIRLVDADRPPLAIHEDCAEIIVGMLEKGTPRP